MRTTVFTYESRLESGYEAAGRDYAYEGDYDYTDTGNLNYLE